MNTEHTLKNEAIRLLAQKSVDVAIEQSIRSSLDPLDALEGAILFNTEALHWATEAKKSILSKRAKLERDTIR